MGRRRKVIDNDPFIREYSFQTGSNVTINQGDIFKVQGEWGGKFKFHSFVINPSNGAKWIDCFELHNGQASAWRSFRPERIKHIPKKRGKRVKRPS